MYTGETLSTLSEHTRRAFFFFFIDPRATHAYTLQPAALVFVSYEFVLVRRLHLSCTIGRRQRRRLGIRKSRRGIRAFITFDLEAK